MVNEPLLKDLYQAIRADLVALLRESHLAPDFAGAVRAALASEGRVLSETPRSRWPLLALLSSQAAGGDRRHALPVAVAGEVVGAATDLFDEVEDGDPSSLVEAYGGPRAINLAFALLCLAAKGLTAAPAAVSCPV